MIVYQNSLITLRYAPETDILLVEWPSAEAYAALEVRESIQKVIEVMNNYNAKHLLIDGSKANLVMQDKEFREMVADMVAQLSKTHLQKLARIITPDPTREEKVYTLRQTIALPFQFHDFRTAAEAMAWLTNGKL